MRDSAKKTSVHSVVVHSEVQMKTIDWDSSPHGSLVNLPKPQVRAEVVLDLAFAFVEMYVLMPLKARAKCRNICV